MDAEERREESATLVVIVVLAVLALASLFFAFGYYCYIRSKVVRRRKALKDDGQKVSGDEVEVVVAAGKGSGVGGRGGGGRGMQVFSYKQMHAATSGFGKGNAIGRGSFGSVYKGTLPPPDGRKVAVKLMDSGGKQGEEEFKMEVELLTRLRSAYLLALIGYCSEGGHRLLVYEYMANGSLQEHLYPATSSPQKRQRVPSAYNRFIREEIQRIKANNPDISHKEAFGAAAKNVLTREGMCK